MQPKNDGFLDSDGGAPPGAAPQPPSVPAAQQYPLAAGQPATPGHPGLPAVMPAYGMVMPQAVQEMLPAMQMSQQRQLAYLEYAQKAQMHFSMVLQQAMEEAARSGVETELEMTFDFFPTTGNPCH